MNSLKEKNYFEEQYKNKGFFSPKDIQFAIYDREIWDLAKEKLKDANSVADLGSGGGTVLYNISKVTNADLVAVDFSHTAAESLKKLVPQAKILKEDVTKTSLAELSIDFVVSTMTIEHVNEDDFLKEVKRILRTGGYFLVTTVLKAPNAWYFYKDREGRPVLEPTHLREYKSEEEFLGLLDRYGFKVIKSNTPRIIFPLIDPMIKLIFGFIKNDFWNSLPAARPIEFLRSITRIPIPGYYAIEVISQKK